MSFSGLSNWIRTFEQRIDQALDIKHEATSTDGNKITSKEEEIEKESFQLDSSTGDSKVDVISSQNNQETFSQSKLSEGAQIIIDDDIEPVKFQWSLMNQLKNKILLDITSLKLIKLEKFLDQNSNLKNLDSNNTLIEKNENLNEISVQESLTFNTKSQDSLNNINVNSNDITNKEEQNNIIPTTSNLNSNILEVNEPIEQNKFLSFSKIIETCNEPSIYIESTELLNIIQDIKDIFQFFDKLKIMVERNVQNKEKQIKLYSQSKPNLSGNSLNDIEKLKNEFSQRLGIEEQRNQKLVKENSHLQREHAKYEVRLAFLEEKESLITNLQNQIKELNTIQTKLEKKSITYQKESLENANKLKTIQSEYTNIKQENEKFSKLMKEIKTLMAQEEINTKNTNNEIIEVDQINLEDIVKKLKQTAINSSQIINENNEKLKNTIQTLENSFEEKEKQLIEKFDSREKFLVQRIEEIELSYIQLGNEKYTKEQELRKQILELQDRLTASEQENELLLTQHLPLTADNLTRDLKLLNEKIDRDQKEWEKYKKNQEIIIQDLETKLKIIYEENSSLKNDFNYQRKISIELQDQLKIEKQNNLNIQKENINILKEKDSLEMTLNSLQKKESKLKQRIKSLQIETNSKEIDIQDQENTKLLDENRSEVVDYDKFTTPETKLKHNHLHHSFISNLASMQSDDSSPQDSFISNLIPKGTKSISSFPNTPIFSGSPISFTVISNEDFSDSFPTHLFSDNQRPLTQFELLQIRDAFRKQNEYLSLLNSRIHTLQQKNEQLTDQIVETKTDQSFLEIHVLKNKLNDKEIEIASLTQDLTHVKEMFRSQICQLLDEIENLKGKEKS